MLAAHMWHGALLDSLLQFCFSTGVACEFNPFLHLLG